MTSQKKILVTGGAGFIGSHIVDTYINSGHDVAVIDNLSSGDPANLNPKARFYKVDLRDAAAVQAVIAREKPNVINHHAAVASVTLSAEDPLSTYEHNLIGTINLLTAGASSMEHFIFASSGGALHSKPRRLPARETDAPTPISPYGFSKYLAEQAVAFYATHYHFTYTVLRYSNVYGPRQRGSSEGGVVAIFTKLTQQGSQPTIYRKQSTRDYVHVLDVASANMLALKNGFNETFHISTGVQTSNLQLYKLIAGIFDWKTEPKFDAARTGEIHRSALSNAKAKRLLKWRPHITLTEGLRDLKHLLIA